METITITLNGIEVSGHEGMTVLNLARESGVEIPTLCHDPLLSSIGACRLCLVENEQTGGLLASCVTPIAPGMTINTNSSRVLEHRRTIIKLLLASHPDTCMVCDKGNRCQLRQIATDLGVGLIDFERIPHIAAIQEVNPFILRDTSKCIMCAKCIRACQELVVEGAVDYYLRGFKSRPATTFDEPLENSECTFCGACVALCPTAALQEKIQVYRGTMADAVTTTCPICGCGCSLRLEVKDNEIVRVTPDKEANLKNALLCVKGSYGFDFIHSPDRLTMPLVKTDDGFKEVSWEQALETIADGFCRILDNNNPDSLAVLGSPKCTNEENYLLQRFARGVLGTNNIDNGGRLTNSMTRMLIGGAIGLPDTMNFLDSVDSSEAILVIGADPASSAPVVEYAIKRAVKFKGARLILIDPRYTRLADFAHIWLRPKMNTDIALLNGLAKAIIDEKLLDEEYVTRKTEGFEELLNILEDFTPTATESITGVSKKELQTTARLFAGAGQATIVFGTGITQSKGGTECIKALANLAILTGNLSRGRGGIYGIQSDCNGQGANEMGALPDYFPGYQSVMDPEVRQKFEKQWKRDLPASPGKTALEFIISSQDGKIKGLYIVGENPVLSFPDSSVVDEALRSLDFLVVQDLYLTETARLADVVLPAASFAEKNGTFTNFEGRENRLNKAIEPPGESRADWEIILQLAGAMGHPMPFNSLDQVMNEIEELAYSHEDYIDLGDQNFNDSVSPDIPQVRGKQILKGFARFFPIKYSQASDDDGDVYPLTLITAADRFHFGNGTRSSRSFRLKKHSPGACIEVSTSDCQKLDINQGDKVKIVSPASQVTAKVMPTENLFPGMLFMSGSFPDAPAASLFRISLDPETKSPALRTCRVRLERV